MNSFLFMKQLAYIDAHPELYFLATTASSSSFIRFSRPLRFDIRTACGSCAFKGHGKVSAKIGISMARGLVRVLECFRWMKNGRNTFKHSRETAMDDVGGMWVSCVDGTMR